MEEIERLREDGYNFEHHECHDAVADTEDGCNVKVLGHDAPHDLLDVVRVSDRDAKGLGHLSGFRTHPRRQQSVHGQWVLRECQGVRYTCASRSGLRAIPKSRSRLAGRARACSE